jgi:hypothetical protein
MVETEKQKKIKAYLQDQKVPKRSWSELLRMARSDKISKATLSRCLRDLEKKTTIMREVDDTHHPPRTYYSWNCPAIPKPVKFNLPRLPDRSIIDGWNKALQAYAKRTKGLHLPRRKDEGDPVLFTWLSGMMIEILLFHIWASSFPEERLDDAVEYLRGQITAMVELYLQNQAKGFIHYTMITRKALLEAAEAFISHTQATAIGGLSQDEYAEQAKPHLQFKPTIR